MDLVPWRIDPYFLYRSTTLPGLLSWFDWHIVIYDRFRRTIPPVAVEKPLAVSCLSIGGYHRLLPVLEARLPASENPESLVWSPHQRTDAVFGGTRHYRRRGIDQLRDLWLVYSSPEIFIPQ